jgi:hypothetical protein
MVAMTVTMVRRGAFAPRVNIELRDGTPATFAVTAAGRPAVSDVRLEYPEGGQRLQAAGGEVPAFHSLRRAMFQIRPPAAGIAVPRELKVRAHKITADHDSQAMPAHVTVNVGDKIHHVDLELLHGQIVLPLTHPSCSVEITLPQAASQERSQ